MTKPVAVMALTTAMVVVAASAQSDSDVGLPPGHPTLPSRLKKAGNGTTLEPDGFRRRHSENLWGGSRPCLLDRVEGRAFRCSHAVLGLKRR
jgi:hypothetical protein